MPLSRPRHPNGLAPGDAPAAIRSAVGPVDPSASVYRPGLAEVAPIKKYKRRGGPSAMLQPLRVVGSAAAGPKRGSAAAGPKRGFKSRKRPAPEPEANQRLPPLPISAHPNNGKRASPGRLSMGEVFGAVIHRPALKKPPDNVASVNTGSTAPDSVPPPPAKRARLETRGQAQRRREVQQGPIDLSSDDDADDANPTRAKLGVHQLPEQLRQQLRVNCRIPVGQYPYVLPLQMWFGTHRLAHQELRVALSPDGMRIFPEGTDGKSPLQIPFTSLQQLLFHRGPPALIVIAFNDPAEYARVEQLLDQPGTHAPTNGPVIVARLPLGANATDFLADYDRRSTAPADVCSLTGILRLLPNSDAMALRDELDQTTATIDRLIRKVGPTEVLFRSHGQVVHVGDYRSLQPRTFLNDAVISFYLKFIQHVVIPLDRRSRYFFHSTFFYTKLRDRTGCVTPQTYKQVRNWAKESLFTKDFVIIPVNQDLHWLLILVCFPGDFQNPPANATRRPAIVVIDSLGDASNSHSVRQMGRNIANYLDFEWKKVQDELKSKGLAETKDPTGRPPILQDRSFRDMPVISARVPRQTNHYDCGVYLLKYVELVARSPPYSSSVFGDLGDWFKAEDIRLLRIDVRGRIRELFLHRCAGEL